MSTPSGGRRGLLRMSPARSGGGGCPGQPMTARGSTSGQSMRKCASACTRRHCSMTPAGVGPRCTIFAEWAGGSDDFRPSSSARIDFELATSAETTVEATATATSIGSRRLTAPPVQCVRGGVISQVTSVDLPEVLRGLPKTAQATTYSPAGGSALELRNAAPRSPILEMPPRLYRRWRQRRSTRLAERYARLSDDEREAISRFHDRPPLGVPARPTTTRDEASIARTRRSGAIPEL